MTGREIREILDRWRRDGYDALDERERRIVAYHPEGTAGGCHACGAVRPVRWKVTES